MADKTIGDYGVEVEKAVANGSTAGVAAVVAEMRATLPPKDPNAAPAEPPAEPPTPTNQGMEAYADKLEQHCQSNNVFETRALAEEMVKVEKPAHYDEHGNALPETPPASDGTQPPAEPAQQPAG